MRIIYKDINLLPDNDRGYISMLEAVINTVDEFSTLEIRRNITDYSFRIAITSQDYLPRLIKELNQLNNLIGIKVDFSKSIRSSSSLAFKINLVK